jgi:hypothetical protein
MDQLLIMDANEPHQRRRHGQFRQQLLALLKVHEHRLTSV